MDPKRGAMKYQALQIKVQKNYSHGLSLLVGYSYHVEKDETFYNDIALTVIQLAELTWQNAAFGYRHRITFAEHLGRSAGERAVPS